MVEAGGSAKAPDIKVDPIAGQSTVAAGSIMQPLYTERRMRCYLVTDSDLSHLSLADWLLTGAASFGAFCLSQGLSIYLNAAFSVDMTRDAKVLLNVVAPLAFVLSILAFVAAVAAYFWRKTHLDIIKRESVQRHGGEPAA